MTQSRHSVGLTGL